MANPAFALSPMTARAASPNDADFEAIREAFLETARGRWFLDEYAKRNRNADTAMVLEAVTRIESSLAAQKQEIKPQAPADLSAAMAAVQTIIAALRDDASAALSGPALDEALAPSRKCARVIREIAWGLRESGADGRICALLDTQVDAINAACEQMAAGGLREGVLRAFDQAAQQIDEIAATGTLPQADAETALHSADEAPAPFAEPEQSQSVAEDTELFDVPPATASADADIEMATAAEASAQAIESEPSDAIQASIGETADLQHDFSTEPEAALEMIFETEVAAGPEPVILATVMEEPVAPVQPSLGESLIASGLVAKPDLPRSDPLAPFRRMNQAERVAFFS